MPYYDLESVKCLTTNITTTKPSTSLTASTESQEICTKEDIYLGVIVTLTGVVIILISIIVSCAIHIHKIKRMPEKV